MKLIYKVDGYKVYAHKILGFDCQVHETETSGVLIRVPMGRTPADRKMFDQLVYFNKPVYWARTARQAISQVRKWIREYQKGVRKCQDPKN